MFFSKNLSKVIVCFLRWVALYDSFPGSPEHFRECAFVWAQHRLMNMLFEQTKRHQIHEDTSAMPREILSPSVLTFFEDK